MLKAQTVFIKVGPTVSDMYWHSSLVQEHDFFDKNCVGIQAGFGLNYIISKRFFLSSSLGYANLGGKYDIDVVDITEAIIETREVKTPMHVLSANTLANFAIHKSEKWNPYIGIGPRAEYLVYTQDSYSILKEFDDINELDRLIYGITGAIGASYKIDKFSFGLEVNFNHNFNEMANFIIENPFNISHKLGYNYFAFLLSVGHNF